MRFYISLLCLYLGVCSNGVAQEHMSAVEILQKCIQKHDPHQKWNTYNQRFSLSMERDGQKKVVDITLDLPNEFFSYQTDHKGKVKAQVIDKGIHALVIDGMRDTSMAVFNENEVSRDNSTYLYEVHNYMMGLPMKLIYDTLYLAPEVSTMGYNSEVCYKLRFDYYPKPENETWYFYVSTVDFSLLGYQFYVEDITSDGEYILLSEMQDWDGILTPTRRDWYWNLTHGFFRTDHLQLLTK